MGNRSTEISEKESLNLVNTSYSYSLDNLLQSVTKGTNTTAMTYYADGLRAAKSTSAAATHYIIYDLSGRLVAERQNTTSISANYVWGPDRVLSKKDSSGGEYYYLYNGHGDVIQTVDRNGNVVNNYKYDEWGNILTSSETISNPFLYTGEVYDKETGLYYLRARYYDPSIGRFLNEDSIEGQINNPLSLNLYSYCYNNPLVYSDPSGHKVRWNQWDNLVGGFIKTGAEITANNWPGNPIAAWNNITGLIDLIGMIVNGEISLDNLASLFKDSIGGDLNWVIDHWYYISDNNKYGDKDVSYFGSRLAGAYAEIVNLGFSVAGIAELANGLTSTVVSINNGGRGFNSFSDLKSYLGSPGEGNQWHHIVEQCQIGKSGFSASQIQNTNNIIAIDKATHTKISGYYSSKQAFTGGKTVRDWLAGQSYEFQYEFGMNILRNYGVIN